MVIGYIAKSDSDKALEEKRKKAENDKLMICIRCNGRKKLYKINSVYSFADTGGQFVDCPMCLGAGRVPHPPKELLNEVVEEKVDEPIKPVRKPRKRREKVIPITDNTETISPPTDENNKDDSTQEIDR